MSRIALERWSIDTPGLAILSAKRLLADIRGLAPDITSRAAEIEAGRRIPPDLVEALRSIGVFRMFVPGAVPVSLDTGQGGAEQCQRAR